MKSKRNKDQKTSLEFPMSQFPVQFPGLSSIVEGIIDNASGVIGPAANADRILEAKIVAGVLRVTSRDSKHLDVPLAAISPLAGCCRADLADFEVDEDGAYLYWPKLDVHLGWEQLEQIVSPVLARKAQRKAHAFNVQYGKAMQAVRREAGVKADEITGLSEEQLLRLERGECPITANDIIALAHAHHVSPNEYLARVAAKKK